MQPSPVLSSPTLRAALAFALAAFLPLAGAGCGKKPAPRADAAQGKTNSAPQVKPENVEPIEEVTRTLGGVELGPLVEGLPERGAILEGALALAQDKSKGVKALIAAGPAASRTTVALLASKGIDEVLGALEVVGADGDPTQSRAQAAEAVLGLLGHEVAIIRDRAWDLAAVVADGEGLLALLERVAPERKAGVIRLLETWDSAAIRGALAALARGADPELAREAAFSLTTAARPTSPEAVTLITEFLASPPQLALGLTLARRLPLPLPADLAKAVGKVIDQSLLSDDLALVLAATRATVVLAVEDRVPLLEQLGRDGREEVRRVVAETLALTGAMSAANHARVNEVLDRLLADTAGSVRIAAIRARGDLSTAPEHAAAAANALSQKLQDTNRGVRLAAAVALSQAAYGEMSRPLLEAQLGREDKPGRALIVEAMAASKSRPLIEAVIAKLDGGVLVPVAHQALVTATGMDFPATQADWMPWLDKTYPAAEPATPKEPAPAEPVKELKPDAAP